jgi:enoyl-CoA hydratase/carnithine racemase
LIITGAGKKSFCAGADIRYVANIDPIEAERYEHEDRKKMMSIIFE